MPKPAILIVDDERLIRLNCGVLLEDIGFRVVEAANGLEALAAFDRELPDLVLTDLRMPEMDGLALIPALINKSPETPVVVISGADRISDAIAAIRQGAWDYITKPIAVRELLINVAKHAQATSARVSLRRNDDTLLVTVEDDGCCFDVADATEHGELGNCFGLFNVRCRIQHLGGAFGIESSPGHGCRVTIGMPLLKV